MKNWHYWYIICFVDDINLNKCSTVRKVEDRQMGMLVVDCQACVKNCVSSWLWSAKCTVNLTVACQSSSDYYTFYFHQCTVFICFTFTIWILAHIFLSDYEHTLSENHDNIVVTALVFPINPIVVTFFSSQYAFVVTHL